MRKKRLSRLLEKFDLAQALDTMSVRMKRHELITYFMALVSKRAAAIAPADVLQQIESDRFVIPSEVSQRAFHAVDSVAFELAEGFEALELSPLAPLGTCGSVAPVDTDWIVHSSRLQELVADCTNMLAVLAARRRRMEIQEGKIEVIRLCSSHRHTRTQAINHPLFSAHFRVFAMVVAGRDKGNLVFEQEALLEQIDFYVRFFRAFPETSVLPLHLTLHCDEEQKAFWTDQLSENLEKVAQITWEVSPQGLLSGGYYWPVRFQLRIQEEEPMDIVDGGFVDWTQKFLSDQKERLLISGIGTEIFLKRYLNRQW